LTVLALSVVTSVSSASLTRGFLATSFGLFLATIGLDQISGDARFTFGYADLRDRIHFVPVLIGMYAFAEVFRSAALIRERASQDFSQATALPSWRELGLIKWVILRSAAIGSVLGALPGAGATMASFVAYNETVRFSKHPEKMGTGQPEGVAASEAADNSAACGAFIPLLALGIPGSATTAIILAAFHVHGLRPGPLLFTSDPDLVNVIFLALFVGNFIMVVLGLLGAKVFSRIVQIPYSILGPAILVMGAIGSYAIRRNVLDLWVVLIFGIIGYIFDKRGIPKAPFILALILGPLVEENLRRALLINRGDFFVMASDPFTAVLLLAALISFLYPILASFARRRRQQHGSP
jgi:putative tricarboxylic transport membrane protein